MASLHGDERRGIVMQIVDIYINVSLVVQNAALLLLRNEHHLIEEEDVPGSFGTVYSESTFRA